MSISGGVLGALSEGSLTPSAVSVSSSSDSLSDHGGLAGETRAAAETASADGGEPPPAAGCRGWRP